MLQKETSLLRSARHIGASLLCLVLFLSGQFHAQFQHYLSHGAQHEALHHTAAEQDACHQAIFHGISQEACEHPTHLTAPNNDCDLCDCLLQTADFTLLYLNLMLSLSEGESIFSYHPSVPQLQSAIALARGPPAVV